MVNTSFQPISQTWKRLDNWAEKYFLEGFCLTNPPATNLDVQSVQAEYNVELPSSFLASLKIHNGSQFGGLPFPHMQSLSCSEIINSINLWKGPPKAVGPDSTFLNLYPHIKDAKAARKRWEAIQKRQWEKTTGRLLAKGKHFERNIHAVKVHKCIQPCFWNLRWIEIASNDYSSLYIDCDPTEFGNIGQVIQVIYEDGEYSLVSKSYEELLANVAEELENGNYPSFV